MTSTATYAFDPASSNLVLVAFGRIGIRRTEITAQHLSDADTEANLLQVKLANRQPNLWKSELFTQVLTPGTATYTLQRRLIAIQSAYLTITSGTGPTAVAIDRVIWPLSTSEYAAIPRKTQQAAPTSYWYDRQITPQITLWPVPNAPSATTYTLNLRALSQIQDVGLRGGATLDMPYRWLDVFVADLAHRLSRIYAPDKEAARKADAVEAWAEAANEDQERVPLYISPALQGYWN